MEGYSVFLHARKHIHATFEMAQLHVNWNIKQVGFNWQGGKVGNDRICGSINVFVYLNKEVTALTVSHHSWFLAAESSERNTCCF